jgi:hypothetical protein
MIKIFAYFSFVLSQKANFCAQFFGENIKKIVTSVPGHPGAKSGFSKVMLILKFQTTAMGRCRIILNISDNILFQKYLRYILLLFKLFLKIAEKADNKK